MHLTLENTGETRKRFHGWVACYDDFSMAQMSLTAIYMKVPEGYVAFVEELAGANSQGETLEEARANLEEAVTMVLQANRELAEQSLSGTEFIREELTLPTA